MIIGIIVALIIFTLVILIHEFGHFITARKFGVKILEFGLGIPPKAKELFTDKYGTKFSLNWLPLGGFVRLNGEENPHLTSPKGEEKTKFYNKNYLQKTIILLAGVFMNFLLASIIFSILFFIGIKPLGINTIIPTNLNSKIIPNYSQSIKDGVLIKKSGIIVNPVSGSIAEKSGIQQGDILIKINSRKINSYIELKNVLQNNKGKKIVATIIKPLSGILTPSQEQGATKYKNIKINLDNSGKIGAYIGDNIAINKDFIYKFGIIDSIKYGFTETYIQSVLTLKGLKILLHKIIYPENEQERTQALKQVSGPIGIVHFIGESYKNGIIFLAIITAIISVNLGVFNLLPIPALDGGRWFLLTINSILKIITKQKIKFEIFENFIHLIFFIILIALSVFIGYNDIENIITK